MYDSNSDFDWFAGAAGVAAIDDDDDDDGGGGGDDWAKQIHFPILMHSVFLISFKHSIDMRYTFSE